MAPVTIPSIAYLSLAADMAAARSYSSSSFLPAVVQERMGIPIALACKSVQRMFGV